MSTIKMIFTWLKMNREHHLKLKRAKGLYRKGHQLPSPLPGLLCFPCATGHSADVHRCQWWSLPLWGTHQSSRKPDWACLPSRSGWPVSTSPRRSGCLTGSQRRSQHSHRRGQCWHRMCHWSPQTQTHQNLETEETGMVWRPRERHFRDPSRTHVTEMWV